jgi:hypothetical protein
MSVMMVEGHQFNRLKYDEERVQNGSFYGTVKDYAGSYFGEARPASSDTSN